ncbi:MAG: cyclase family protein, partial [Candidatus Eremiobacteraeota bacterium]|nr:cyclase family protein [Candidatus Eremiobacteraeota bacterium]
MLRAAAEIRTGERFCLSLPLNFPGGNVLHPTRFPPQHKWVERMDGVLAQDFPFSHQREGATGVVNDDIVTLYTQYSSQWDAFAHVGSTFDADGDGKAEIVYYNGTYPGPDVEEMATACIVGRGVMVDL